MKTVLLIARILLGVFITYGGINHFLNPALYAPFIPDFLPEALVNYGSGILEIILGVGLFVPGYKQWAAFGIFLLMIAFLPLHVIDVFAANPAVGSKSAAYIRLPVQFVFIAWAWWVWKDTKK
ncbi:DoxX family protein [Microscilla marina]|uniref:Fjo21 n=1 Tax=Microscilla marina ATCC 23134 TaxID=313606 RepID=A1ZIZ9_MICM2|nr:MauE/DoxX family redox-associated membrane protein [Microscilla marina]EAY29535.1 Fjo21 [Microscilla marina ATCC 23134]